MCRFIRLLMTCFIGNKILPEGFDPETAESLAELPAQPVEQEPEYAAAEPEREREVQDSAAAVAEIKRDEQEIERTYAEEREEEEGQRRVDRERVEYEENTRRAAVQLELDAKEREKEREKLEKGEGRQTDIFFTDASSTARHGKFFVIILIG